jgi:hypothetical protein
VAIEEEVVEVSEVATGETTERREVVIPSVEENVGQVTWTDGVDEEYESRVLDNCVVN